MSFRLVPLMKGKIPIIPLTRPVLVVGRHSECDIQLAQPPISRFHCCIALAYDRILVRDLGSRNGLRVNGMIVEETRVFMGDEIAIGPVIFRLVPDEEGEPSPPGAVRTPPGAAGTRPMPDTFPDPGDEDSGLIPLDGP